MARRPQSKQVTANYHRARMVQLLTMRDRIDNLTAADLSRMVGLPEPECQAALVHQQMLRAAAGRS